MKLLRKVIYLALLSLCSCNTSGQQSVMKEIDYAGWQYPAQLSLDIYDTCSMADIQIALRYDSEELIDSLDIIIATTAPDGVRWNDRVKLQLPNQERGITNRDFDFRHSVKWGQSGEYRFIIYPQRKYRGISAIGFNFKEATTK